MAGSGTPNYIPEKKNPFFQNFPSISCEIPKFENGILLYTHKTSNFSIKVLHTWFKITLYTIDPNTWLTVIPHYISCNFLPKECYKQKLFWIFFWNTVKIGTWHEQFLVHLQNESRCHKPVRLSKPRQRNIIFFYIDPSAMNTVLITLSVCLEIWKIKFVASCLCVK